MPHQPASANVLIALATELGVQLTPQDANKISGQYWKTCGCKESNRDLYKQTIQLQQCHCRLCCTGRREECEEDRRHSMLATYQTKKCSQCQSLLAAMNRLAIELAERCKPIVQGLHSKLRRRISELSESGATEAMTASFLVANALIAGTCDCSAEQDRMRRDPATGNCGVEHSLNGWANNKDCLNRFLLRAILNHTVKDSDVSDVQIGDSEALKKSASVLSSHSPKDRSKGMAVRQFLPALGVFQIPVCDQCGQNVTLRNQCNCTTNGSSRFPIVTELTYILDDIEQRTNLWPDGATIEMYRVQLNIDVSKQAPCVHGGDKNSGRTLVFPDRDEGGAKCPVCGEHFAGRQVKASHPDMEKCAVLAASGRTHSPLRNQDSEDWDNPHEEPGILEGHLEGPLNGGAEPECLEDPDNNAGLDFTSDQQEMIMDLKTAAIELFKHSGVKRSPEVRRFLEQVQKLLADNVPESEFGREFLSLMEKLPKKHQTSVVRDLREANGLKN